MNPCCHQDIQSEITLERLMREVGSDGELYHVQANTIAALRKELEEYRKTSPLCEKHKPDGGVRSGCLVCGLMEMSAALSQIDYLAGEPNEMRVSSYDLHYDPAVVVSHVRARLERQGLHEEKSREG